MIRRALVWLSVLGCGCGSAGGGAASTDGSSGSGSGGTTTGAPQTTGTTGDASTTGGESTSGGGGSSSSTGTGGLPDYTDSPCYGMPAQTLVYDGQTHQTVSVNGTCRAEGDRSLLIVQDELWGNTIDQAAVADFMHRYELFSPAASYDPSQGVLVNDIEVFGDLPPGLPNGKMVVFVVDTNGGGDGYLCTWCDFPQLHIDGVTNVPLDGDVTVAIAAHESYHGIHHGYDPDEVTWVDESMAEAAMTMNGFFTDTDWLADFRMNPDQNWGPANSTMGGLNYGAALLWGSFLWEHGGPDLMRAITAEPANDWMGIDNALVSVGDDKTAWDLYLDMIVAAYLDDPSLGYGFESFDVGEMHRMGDLAAGSMQSGSLQPYGIDYWRITAPGDRALTVTATGTEPVIGLGVAAGTQATVVPIDTSTPLTVGPNDTAFVALTARGAATYDLQVQ